MVPSSCHSPVEARTVNNGRLINPFASPYTERIGKRSRREHDGGAEKGSTSQYRSSQSPLCGGAMGMGDRESAHETASSQRKRIAVAVSASARLSALIRLFQTQQADR